MALGARDTQVCITCSNVKSFLAVLQTIKSTSKQPCTLIIGHEGFSARLEDDSRSLFSSVFVAAQLFADFKCPGAKRTLGIPLNQLIDILNVFSAGFGGDLNLKYPGPSNELLCEMVEESGAANACTYASISTSDAPYPADPLDHWSPPVSHFIINGAFLKEAIEDLEWSASGSRGVELQMSAQPPSVSLCSYGSAGDLLIDLPSAELQGFSCQPEGIHFTYKHKHLRAAFTSLSVPKDASASISTKVTIDSQGMVKAVHLVNMASAAKSSAMSAPISYSALPSSQAGGVRSSVIQFVVIPEEELDAPISE
ncbi:hypothetical protein WJX74_004858 [Apatococcus lobatus]|uniref:Uncharacterized protein n=1 Tax=Apatococcus lobatus TaxID=904363 RepID=A0AAW1S4R5_9CHLO